MKIPKGGLHNINQSSQANINDSWNVLATDENNAVLIAVDKCGTKKTVGDTTEIKNSIQALEQENIEQDNRLNLVEQENQNQNTLISELRDDVTNLEGIHYTWSPTNRTLTLYDNNGKILSSVTFEVSNINGLQTALNGKLDKGSLTSNDDSLLVEGENIEVQLSIYSEEFEQKIFNLTFTPINILGVYKNGIYLRTSEFILNLPKSITINNYNTNDIVIVQYQHLKTDI